MSIVKTFDVGEGDMFYIKHNSSNFTIIDCYLTEDNKDRIISEIINEKAGKDIVRFISTHPDKDHIGGIKLLNEKLQLLNFYCVKNNYDADSDEDFQCYYELRDDTTKAFYLVKGCERAWMNKDDEIKKYGSSGLNILWPITTNSAFKDALSKTNVGDSPNNISPIVTYTVNKGIKMIWFGDLENSFTEEIKDVVSLPEIDIVFAPHHGRESGLLPNEWLEQMKPKIIVIGEAPSEYLNYYNSYNTITQNSAKDITFICEENEVHIYTSNLKYSVDYLDNKHKENKYGKYIGTLVI